MNKKRIELPHNEIVTFVEKKSENKKSSLDKSKNFIRLSARSLKDEDDFLISKLKGSNNKFILWGIAVLGELKSKKSVPVLLDLLTNINLNISEGAYRALKRITGINPAKKMKKKINSPDVLIRFKEYYLEHRSDHKKV